jgi:hypothetical protein
MIEKQALGVKDRIKDAMFFGNGETVSGAFALKSNSLAVFHGIWKK